MSHQRLNAPYMTFHPLTLTETSMFTRLYFALTLIFAAPLAAQAQDFQDYNEENFQAALASGKPVVINFYETWCTRCATQRRNLSALTQNEPYNDFIVLEAIFSEERAFAGSMGINTRTSMALIVDRRLVATDVGSTSAMRVQNFLDQAL